MIVRLISSVFALWCGAVGGVVVMGSSPVLRTVWVYGFLSGAFIF